MATTTQLTHGVSATFLPHGWEVVGRHQHFKQVIKWFGLEELAEPTSIETESTESARESPQYLTSDGYLERGTLLVNGER